MSTATLTSPDPAIPESAQWMTTEELLALPEDPELDRWLLHGKLIEHPMTRRSYFHSRTEAQIARLLKNWSDQQPTPRGMVVSGEAGFRLGRSPDFTVGIDVAYLSPELTASTSKKAVLIDGPPVLAVEILSPSDRLSDVGAKIEGYLEAGVKTVWRVEPAFNLITVFRVDREPESFNLQQEIDGEPFLPGFHVPVAEIFA